MTAPVRPRSRAVDSPVEDSKSRYCRNLHIVVGVFVLWKLFSTLHDLHTIFAVHAG